MLSALKSGSTTTTTTTISNSSTTIGDERRSNIYTGNSSLTQEGIFLSYSSESLLYQWALVYPSIDEEKTVVLQRLDGFTKYGPQMYTKLTIV